MSVNSRLKSSTPAIAWSTYFAPSTSRRVFSPSSNRSLCPRLSISPPRKREHYTSGMEIKSLHHVAYRCKDAKKTADFYTKVLDLEYAMAVSEDRVPSTGEEHPYMHIFFRMDDGSYVAFFELPEMPEMGRDGNTPLWVQHLALRV